jgi:hypothetical protein
MSSFSQFKITLDGPKADQDQFPALIEAAAFGLSRDGDIIIPFTSIFPDWNESEEYRAFWITPNDGQLFLMDGDRLTFHGESRNTPPIRFLVRISEQYPSISFQIESVTEHTMVETWFVQDGHAKLMEAFEDAIREPQVWYVKDGISLGPLPDWIKQHYPLNK